MTDFLSWFLYKHWIVSAMLFPEAAFAFAVWERCYWWAAFVGFTIALKRIDRCRSKK